MATAQIFQALYRKLNPQQKRAVDAIEGPVMVIAGPGTGKTQILTLRIANILRKTDTAPDSILALTFTESGVFSMRKRLVEMIGSDGYRVNIYTFHGFCNEVIKEHPDEFPRIIGATNITEVDKISLIKNIIVHTKELEKLKPFGDNYFYVNPIRSQISELKRENITPKDFKKLVKEQEDGFKAIDDLYHEKGKYKGEMKGKYKDLLKKIDKNKELMLVYEAYEHALEERRLYDFEDMILEVIRALKVNKDLLLKLQEEYQYLLADEHQDANNAQNVLLELLASFHEEPNIFVVGDEKQAIFRFQGASLDNFLYFKRVYKNAELIQLEDNYRSTQEILDSAHSLIARGADEEGLRIPLTSKRDGKGEAITIHAFSKPDLEYLFLAEDTKEKIEEGVEPHEIAVLYRNNRDADAIARILEKAGIPFAIESNKNVLQDIDIRKLLIILETIFSFGSDAKLVPLLHIDFFEVDNLDLYKIASYARKERISYFEVLESSEHLKSAKVKAVKELRRLFTILTAWHTKAHNMDLLDFLDMVIQESGFLPYILESEFAIEKLEKLNGLFDDVKALVEVHHDYKLPELITYFKDLEEHNIFINKASKSITPKGVRLMTAHRSKGLEFDYVYITDTHDGHWGNKKTVNYFTLPTTVSEQKSFDDNDDERRLFYVALTRARVGVALLYAKENQDGKALLPSQFVEEIDKNFKVDIDTKAYEQNVDKNILLTPSRKVAVPPLKDKEFLNELFLDQGMSVTALNNYLTCPWSYFYSSLLRIPKSLNKHLLFGNAVHYTLKYYFDKLLQGEDIGEKKLLILFGDNVARQPFNEADLVEAKTKGERALAGYYQHYKSIWNQNIKNEFKITALLSTDELLIGRLKLRGDIDKIEFLSETQVNVVDYKTGKPKSRNIIEGNTKSSNGDYKRQLVFYNLLLNLYESGKYKMVSGEIDFVEPDERGKYHKEQFIIENDEIEELKRLITSVSEEILNLSFWDKECDNSKCEYCALRKMMA